MAYDTFLDCLYSTQSCCWKGIRFSIYLLNFPPTITQILPVVQYKDADDDGTTRKPAVWLSIIPEQWLSYCYIYIYIYNGE